MFPCFQQQQQQKAIKCKLKQNHKLLEKFRIFNNEEQRKGETWTFQLTLDLNWGFNRCTGNSKLNVFKKSLSRDEF